MKKFVLAAALTAFASTTMAGSIDPAPVDIVIAQPMVTEASSSSNGIILPLLIVALIAAAAK